MSKESDKLIQARCRLMTREPWYGHAAMSMRWIPNQMSWLPEPQRTMGVRIVNGGEIQCLYYPPFVNSLTLKELYAVIQHEIEHIVRLHCIRVSYRDMDLWNIATDMTVNGSKDKPKIGYRDNNQIIIPHIDKLVWIPAPWPQDGTAEEYYDLLDTGQKYPIVLNNDGGNIDDHSIWNQSDVSQDEARQIVKSMVDQITNKCQGLTPGHLQEAIDKLNKPIVRWRELLRQYIGRFVGNRRVTYTRRNRRRDWFGVPGFSHHAATNINVIVDISGSISKNELQQFFAEIDIISHKANVMVLQWDDGFHGYTRYRRGDWKRLAVNGRGGTNMSEPIQWLIDNNKILPVQIMLTDGYCDYIEPDVVKFPMITVVTGSAAKIPNYGHVVAMKL